MRLSVVKATAAKIQSITFLFLSHTADVRGMRNLGNPHATACGMPLRGRYPLNMQRPDRKNSPWDKTLLLTHYNSTKLNSTRFALTRFDSIPTDIQ